MEPSEYIRRTSEQLSNRLGLEPSSIRESILRYEDELQVPEEAPGWMGSIWQLLKNLRSGGIEGVSLLSNRDGKTCEACFEADGNRYRLEKALETNPLPHPDCTNRPCRCTYRPLLDMDTE